MEFTDDASGGRNTVVVVDGYCYLHKAQVG